MRLKRPSVPVETVEPEWYRHVRRIKAALAGKDRNFHRDRTIATRPRVIIRVQPRASVVE